jgi:hypothetical protein
MFLDWASFLLIGIAATGLWAGVGALGSLRAIRNLLIWGAVFRIVGVLARHTMIFDLYGGTSDAVAYFEAGRVIAEHFRAFDFSIVGSGQWGNREWGTQAIRYASGLVLAFVGPSVRAAFLVFSLGAFVGLVCLVVASGRASTPGAMRRTAWLLFFWPTLWFWPSSIGKEAVLLLAFGLVTLGYVGRGERIHWLPMVAGLALALAIRPHVAGVLVVSACVAEWAARGWTTRRIAQTVLVSGLAIWLLSAALGLLGLAGADADGFRAFVLDRADVTNQGGSAVGRAGSLVAAVPMAFVNILFRPFITEANGSTALASSLEMMVFWVLVGWNRNRIWSVVSSWRLNRLLRFAIPFSLLYILMIGLTFQNLGIIARQRALVMPALLLMLVAAPAPRTRSVRAMRARRLWRTPALASARS